MSHVTTATDWPLGEQARSVSVVRSNPAWSLDVAVCDDDWERAEVLLRVELPHRPGALEVRHHRDGTWWSDPTTAEGRRLVAWTEPYHDWGDEQSGRIRTMIRWRWASLTEEMERARWSAMAAASSQGQRGARELGAALAIAASYSSGPHADTIRRAAGLMQRGQDDDELCKMVGTALRTRLWLEQLAFRIRDARLIDALARGDSELAPFGEALLLLPEAEYAACVEGHEVDEEAWWGLRARLDAGTSVKDLANELAGGQDEARRLGQGPGQGVFLAAAARHDLVSTVNDVARAHPTARRIAFESALRELQQTPAPWLRADLREAVVRATANSAEDRDLAWRMAAISESVSPAPGRVVLPLYLPERNEGMLVELRIERSDAGLWTRAAGLQPLARDAIRAAHAAAAALSVTGQPRFRLEEHAVAIIASPGVLEAVRGIDGDSIGLPAFLAFASLWLGQPIPRDLAASGAIDSDLQSLASAGPAAFDAKIRALAAWARPSQVRLIAPHAPAVQAAPGVDVLLTNTLREALAHAGLDLQASRAWQALGDVSDRVAALESAVRDIKTQRLASYRVPGMDPWLVLADRARLLAKSLEGVRSIDPAFLDMAWAQLALAYTHAGDVPSACAVRVPDDPSAPPAVRVLALMSRLVATIGTDDLESSASIVQKLDQATARLGESERPWLAGLVRGTQGRAWMHARNLGLADRLARAIPLLREAVEHHVRYVPIEAGRSRIYLAMALRMASRFEQAATELQSAASEIELYTRPWSGSYYAATRMYLAYERARLRVASATSSGDLVAAMRDTEDALRDSRARGGFWPTLGILRTRVWALMLLGDHPAASVTAAEARALAATAPAGVSLIVSRITGELEAPNMPDGEVY